MAFAIDYVPSDENLGPAGGIALGMSRLLEIAEDHDWIVTLDDDDPPEDPDILSKLKKFAEEMLDRDPATAGVGYMGARFDYRRGQTIRIEDHELGAPVPVDHIGGNQFPVYSVRSIRRVGPFDARLFFGLEELEFGLRLRSAGYSLYAHGDMWARRRERNRRLGISERPKLSFRGGKRGSSWRRYYTLRNLIAVLRAAGRPGTAVWISLARGIGKPLANLLVDPKDALRHLGVGLRACWDGWTGKMGRTFEPTVQEAAAPARPPRK